MSVFQMEKVVIMVESVLSHLFHSDISACIVPLPSIYNLSLIITCFSLS